MLKDHSETRTESTLVADHEDLKPITAILQKHSLLFIESSNVEIPMKKASFERVCQMSQSYPEEAILFTFRTKKPEPNSDDEDSFMFSYRNNQRINKVIDTEDVLHTKSNANDNDELNNNLQTLANSGDLEQGIIDSMTHKSFFERNITAFIFLWELSYLALLLSGVVVFCHLNFYAFAAHSLLCPYLLSGMVVNGLLFFAGFLGLYYIKILKVQLINETWENVLLVVLIVCTLGTFILGEYAVSQPMVEYLTIQSFFELMFYWLLFNESACLLLNFKMNQFYVEYIFLLPLRIPLLPSRSMNINQE